MKPITLNLTFSPLLLMLAGIGLIFLFPLWRALLWRVFRFDNRVKGILSQKKSSEVRLGQIGECLAPLLANFPVKVGTEGSSTVFLGQPIDYIHFAADGTVTFIEIKTGNAKLTPFQRNVKAAVQAGRVTWSEMRIK